MATSIAIFLVLYVCFILIAPSFCFDKQKHLMQFGLNYKNKTIFPAWLIVIIIAIVSYFFTYFYSHNVQYFY